MEPYQLVKDCEYFRGVLGNMGGSNVNSKAQWGTGHPPNYQVHRDGKQSATAA